MSKLTKQEETIVLELVTRIHKEVDKSWQLVASGELLNPRKEYERWEKVSYLASGILHLLNIEARE